LVGNYIVATVVTRVAAGRDESSCCYVIERAARLVMEGPLAAKSIEPTEFPRRGRSGPRWAIKKVSVWN